MANLTIEWSKKPSTGAYDASGPINDLNKQAAHSSGLSYLCQQYRESGHLTSSVQFFAAM
jgi:hypothetical protein